MKNRIFCLLLLGLSVGCTKRAVFEAQQNEREVVVFGAPFKALTKVAYDGDVELAGLQFVSEEGTAGIDFRLGNSFSGTRQKGGRITFSERQTYDAKSTSSLFLASYFPKGSRTNNQVGWRINGGVDIMLAQSTDLGTHAEPILATLNYEHQLGQLEVVCCGKAGSTATQLAARWGKITSIRVCETPVDFSLSLEHWSTTTGSRLLTLALLAKDYTAPFAPIDIPLQGSTAVQAAGLLVPWTPARTGLELEVVTERVTKRIAVDFGQPFARGQRHTVALLFSVSDELIQVQSTSIHSWREGMGGQSDVYL